MERFGNNQMLHKPVMVDEVLEFLNLALLKKHGRYIDATLGTGGHTLAIIEVEGQVLGIEVDKKMLEVAKKRLAGMSAAKLINANFKDIDEIAEKAGYTNVDGIVFDLGVSNLHLKSQQRGFSFEKESTLLDMRLDPDTQGVTGADLLNSLRRDQLEELFEVVMEKNEAKKLTKEVLNKREEESIKTVGDFLEIIKKAKIAGGKLNPATKPFLALRMAVNSELENLKLALPKAFGLLKKKGRLVVISFHSGEDALVKRFFKEMQTEGLAKILTKKPIQPSDKEIKENPRARSAKLRCLERLR